MCHEPRTDRGGGRGARARAERGQQQFCAPRGAHSPSPGGRAARSPGQALEPRPGPPEASRRSLRSPPSSPRRAGRGTSTKDSNFRAGAGPPRQLLAQARPAFRKRAANARAAGSERGGAGAGARGRQTQEGGREGEGAWSYSGSLDFPNGRKKSF